MSKSIKLTITTLAVGAFLCCGATLPTYAAPSEEVVDGEFEEPEIEPPVTTPETTETTETIDTTSIEIDNTENGEAISTGTEVVESEEIEEPVLWPMYLSFGAIAATLLLVVIINIASRARKK